MKKKKLKTTARKKSATGKTTKTARPASKVALKGTVLKSKPRKAELRHVAWSSVEVEALNPLLGRHFVVGENVMLARVLLKKGCLVPDANTDAKTGVPPGSDSIELSEIREGEINVQVLRSGRKGSPAGMQENLLE